MKIYEIKENKKAHIGLLLLADEQESMIDKYPEAGAMYVLDDEGIKAECVVTDEGGGVLEIKNIAVLPECQKKGYGRTLIEFIERKYSADHNILRVGTGDSPMTIPFYNKCGFTESYRIPDFFTDNYDHPIYECGVKLTDMVCLEKNI